MALRALVWEVIKDAVRKKLFYFIFLVTLALLFLTPRLPSFEIGVQLALYRDLSLGLALISITILALALSSVQVNTEVEKKTLYNVLSKPVSRTKFILAKYLGVILILFASSVLIGILISFFAFLSFGRFDISFFPAVFFIFLEGALISAFGILFSSFTTPVISVFCGILFYFTGHANQAFVEIVLGDKPARDAFFYTVKAFSSLLPNLELFNFNEALARGVRLPFMVYVTSTLYAALYILALLLIANLTFSRKDV